MNAGSGWDGEPEEAHDMPNWVPDALATWREGRLALCLRQSLQTDAEVHQVGTDLRRRGPKKSAAQTSTKTSAKYDWFRV